MSVFPSSMVFRHADAVPGLAALLGDLQEADHLLLALDAGGAALRQALDQPGDPLADLEREVGGDRSREGTNVLDGRLAAWGEAVWALVLAHRGDTFYHG